VSLICFFGARNRLVGLFFHLEVPLTLFSAKSIPARDIIMRYGTKNLGNKFWASSKNCSPVFITIAQYIPDSKAAILKHFNSYPGVARDIIMCYAQSVHRIIASKTFPFLVMAKKCELIGKEIFYRRR